MLDDIIIKQLQAIVGKDNVLIGNVNLTTYSYDATADVPRAMPEVIVMPTSTEQVRKVVQLAAWKSIAIYPRGAGTNLSGGTIPLDHGIVLSLQKMDQILEIDAENLTATVQPGVVIQDLNNAIAPYGLMYPPDPGTVTTATMGVSVAENSGGLRGLKYGVTTFIGIFPEHTPNNRMLGTNDNFITHRSLPCYKHESRNVPDRPHVLNPLRLMPRLLSG